MVIECAHCQARFKLADDKLKTEGTKVRCSKCKEIFTVFPPTADSAPPPPAPAAVPAQPPVSANQIDFGEISFGSASATEREPTHFDPTPTGVSFEMEDIAQGAASSFPEPDPGATMVIPAGGGTTPSFAAPASEPEGAFGDFNFDQAPGITLSPPPTAESPDFGDFDFGATSSAAPQPAAAAAHDPFAFGETPGGDFDFGASDPAPSAATSTSGGGPREDFDFSGMSFGDENATQVFQAPRPAAAQAPPPTTEPTPKTTVTRPMTESRPRPLPSAIPVPRPRSRNLGGTLLRIFSYLLVTAMVVVAGAAIYYYQYPGRFDTRKLISESISTLINKTTATPEERGQIRLANLSSNFLTGTTAGDLFVIRGDATNEFKKPRSVIAVKAILFDKQGQMLRQQIVFCGNPMSDETLRTTAFKKIEETMANQLGASLANFEVPPGKTIPFTVVFLAPPAELAEFTVEPADIQGAAPPK